MLTAPLLPLPLSMGFANNGVCCCWGTNCQVPPAAPWRVGSIMPVLLYMLCIGAIMGGIIIC